MKKKKQVRGIRVSSVNELKKKLLEDLNLQNNIVAANELAKVSEREEAIKILRRGFEIPDANLHIALINALVKHKAKEAVSEISSCLKSLNPSERNTAMQALVNSDLRDAKVVGIFKNRLRFERKNDVKVLYIQRLAELPYEETIDFLLNLLKDDRFRVPPLIENVHKSLSIVAHISPEKLVRELDSPVGEEIVKIITSIDLSTYPDVWDSLVQSLDADSQPLYEKIHNIIVKQITTTYDEKRVSDIIGMITSIEASGRMRDRCIKILDALSGSPHGSKLIKPTLELVKKLTEEEIKRKKFVDNLEIEITHFDVAESYFEEAKNCYVKGFIRPSIISAMSALESCVKLDYINNVAKSPDEGEKYVREVSVHKLLNKYFNVKDIGRLPKQYEDFSNIHIKIRNSLVHPEEFEFSESTAEYVLRLIAELIKHLEGKQ